MKYDETTIKQNIAKNVEENYGIEIETIGFIPVGEESYTYLITDKNKDKFFAKYCAKKNILKSIDATNKLLSRLKHLSFVVPPIEVGNKTSFSLLKGKLYLFPYINGKVITARNSKWDKELTSKIMDIMAKIHNSTHLIDFNLPKETFDNNFSERLSRLLDSIGNKSTRDKDTILLLTKNRALIEKVIDLHTELGNKYKKSEVEFVLTHGDITGLNIIKTEKALKLVDWDGVMFAPAERDINFFSSNPYFSVDAYLKKTGKNQYFQELRDYYGQQLSLNSIIGNFETLLSKRSKYVDKKESLDEIREYLNYFK